MNIAFPAIFIFLLILPGFAFRASFRKSEKTNLDHKPFAEATFLGVLAAMLLHAIWVLLSGAVTNYTVDYQTAFTLLVGQRGVKLDSSIAAAMEHPQAIFVYHLSLLLFSWVAGALLRGAVTKYQWDQEGPLSPLLRFDTPWYYLFSAVGTEKEIDGVYVSAIVPVNKDVSFLYTGILKEYFFADGGELERLVISNASRRKIEQDKSMTADENQSHKDCFYPIEGDYLVLRYSEIITLNIQYIRIETVE